MRIVVILVTVIALSFGAAVTTVLEHFDRRLAAIERALAARPPAASIAAPATATPETDRARYERLYQQTRDASAAAAYVTERARAADRAHVSTPRSSSR